jgi:hypothetical protein
MRRRHAALLVSFGLAVGLGGWQLGSPLAAKEKKPAAPAAAGKAVNACGCYADTQDNCFCGRKGKCDCPGECEPKGCEEKRAKQMQKEIAAETKKATEAEKRQKKSGDGERPAPKSKSKKQDKDKASDGAGDQPPE